MPREIVSAIMTVGVRIALVGEGREVRGSYSCRLACCSWLADGCGYTVTRATYHHFIVLYLISAFVSSPNGSSLPWNPRVGGTSCFSGSDCPPEPLSLECLSVTLSSLSGF